VRGMSTEVLLAPVPRPAPGANTTKDSINDIDLVFSTFWTFPTPLENCVMERQKKQTKGGCHDQADHVKK
jgi:hypothetical protein